MKITSIIENTSSKAMPTEHGLSLYIEKDDGQRVLFDMGQTSLFAKNAEALSLDIADVDIAVVSHGHYDHGGGLPTFLQLNKKAKVFVHKDAFLPHYSLRDTGLRYIGLDSKLEASERLTFCSGTTTIAEGMTLFSDVQGHCCTPAGNKLLFGPAKDENDTFCHEQSLIIEEGQSTVLLAGCAHRGIVNILRQAERVIGKAPTHVLAGMHLVKSGLSEADEQAFIQTLATELQSYSQTAFYTMHCTGEAQFQKLQAIIGSRLSYMACGDHITL